MKLLIALFQTDDTSNAPHLVTAADHATLLKKAVNWCKEVYCMSDVTALGILTMDQLNEWLQTEVDRKLCIHVYKEEI